MDISKLRVTEGSNAGAVYHVNDPFNEEPAFFTDIVDSVEVEKPVTVTLLGPDSDVYRKASLNSSRKVLKKRGKVDPQDLDDSAIFSLAECILGWEGLEDEGQPIQFTRQNAIALLRSEKWLRDQLNEFHQDRRNFLAK